MDRLKDKIQCNPTVKLTKGNSYPFVSMEHISSGCKNILPVEEETYRGQSCSKFRNGDTIMARITPCLENGKIAQYNSDSEFAMGSTELFVFRSKENLSDDNYIYYLLSTDYIRQNAVNSMTGASGRQRADINFVSKIKWNFPEYTIQCKIGKILSTYDDLIEKNNRKIAILQEMAEELYKEWFVRFRFPGYKTVKFKDGIPEGWETKPLHEWLIDHFNGGWGNEISTQKTPYDAFVIRGTDIEDIKNAIIESVPLRYHKSNDINTKLLKEYDIVLELSNGNINNIGRTLFINKQILAWFDKVMCASFCKTLRFKDKNTAFLIWQYINYLQNSGLMSYYKNTGANGINNFNFKRFLEMQISIPRDLSCIDDLMKYYDAISLLNGANYTLRKQRDLLLPRLMSGKLEVKA